MFRTDLLLHLSVWHRTDLERLICMDHPRQDIKQEQAEQAGGRGVICCL
jgi:hypothetical protein